MSSTAALPNALQRAEEITAHTRGRRLLVCLDYDGTLTPMAATPELAVLAPQTREVLAALSQRRAVAVISGRDLDDVRGLVGLDQLYYAGSHGLRIAGPGGALLHQVGARFVPRLRHAARQLQRRLAELSGVWLEPKDLSVAAHFRQAPQHQQQVHRAMQRAASEHEQLTVAAGRKVYELRPTLDWHKGRAVQWLLSHLDHDMALFVGDDATDEDALEAVQRSGVGIAVADRERQTAATYTLASTDQVRRFLEALVLAVS